MRGPGFCHGFGAGSDAMGPQEEPGLGGKSWFESCSSLVVFVPRVLGSEKLDRIPETHGVAQGAIPSLGWS